MSREVLPRWSGDVLDLVVDILNYVFVPAYAVAASGLVPPAVAIPLGILIVVTGSLYFADRLMKTSDYYFRGFPAVWNVAVFYLFVLKPDPLPATVSIATLAVFTFVPFHVVHPMRIAHLREITLVALIALGAARGLRRCDKSRSGFLDPGRTMRSRDLFHRRGVLAPPPSVTPPRS